MSNAPSLMALAWTASVTMSNVSWLTSIADFPAAALTRESSLSGRQVVINVWMRSISAMAASNARWAFDSSTAGFVYAANDKWVPIALPSPVTLTGVNAALASIALRGSPEFAALGAPVVLDGSAFAGGFALPVTLEAGGVWAPGS